MNIGAKIKKIYICLLKLLPRKKCVVFDSYHGQYNDNPRYISEKLHEINSNIDIYWVLSNDSKEAVPEYVRILPIYGFRHDLYIHTAKVVVDNYNGIRRMEKDKESRFSRFYSEGKKRLNISTWHGSPIKKIGFDKPGINSDKVYYTSTSYMLAGCKYVRDVFSTAFPGVEVRMYGTPRNDFLFNDLTLAEKDCLKEKLHLPKKKKVLLFAPTFRDNPYESGVRQIENLDIPQLLQTLSNKFSGDWVFVYRVHHEVLSKVDYLRLDDDLRQLMYPGNVGEDMAEYLQIADALITDYSGSIFDYALLHRPCFLFALDREHYANIERGFYISLSELPFPFSESSDELCKCIANFNDQDNRKRIDSFLKKIGNIEDGNASERVAQDIIDFLENMK